MGTLIVGGILLLVVTLIIRGIIRDHKMGKHTCGGNCSACHGTCSHSVCSVEKKEL